MYLWINIDSGIKKSILVKEITIIRWIDFFFVPSLECILYVQKHISFFYLDIKKYQYRNWKLFPKPEYRSFISLTLYITIDHLMKVCSKAY